jgi:manganese transport protein
MALLVATQVVLSLQLPFAIVPLLRFTSGRGLMGPFASSVAMRLTGWSGAALVISANSWLVLQTGLQLSGLYFFLAMAGALLCTALLVYIALVPLNGPAPGGPFPAHANSPIPAIQHG